MEKKSKIWQWAAILGGAGLVYYFYNKNKTATTTTTTTTVTTPAPVSALPTASTVITPGLPVTPPSTVTILTPETFAPAQLPAAPAPVNAAAASTDQQTVIDYFKSSLDEANLNQFNNSMASFTPAEWSALWDLLVNDWRGGQGNTPARMQFWDTWRTKYHILDGTYA